MKKNKNTQDCLASRLRELRKLHNLTQEQIAEHLDVTRNTYAKYETGEIENLSTSTYQTLFYDFGVSLDYLIVGETHDINSRYSALITMLEKCTEDEYSSILNIIKTVFYELHK